MSRQFLWGRILLRLAHHRFDIATTAASATTLTGHHARATAVFFISRLGLLFHFSAARTGRH